MDLENYIVTLKNLNPSDYLLLKSGFTSIPNSIIKNYILDKRESQDLEEAHDVIFELFEKYDPQYLRFADFSFYNTIKKTDDLFIIGGSSYSELAFKSPDSEVIEYDREEWSILNYCAKNPECFLEALLVIFEMYSLRYQSIVSRVDSEANNKYLERCTQTAGGNKYRRFYENVIR